jgi:flagellar motility protein MotE (MotC chaperone)
MLRLVGGLAVAFLSFTGCLHGILYVQGKYDPETLGRYHDWPGVGGFFPAYVAPPPEPTEEEKRMAETTVRIHQTRSDFRLPAPYDEEELKRLVAELAEARAKTEETRRVLADEEDRLKRAEADLAERQATVTETAAALKTQADELLARFEEFERERLFVRDSESKNIKTLAAVYEAMPPQEAAAKLDQLDADTTAKLVAVMQTGKAGKILAAMSTPRAVEITKRIQARTSADAKR